MHIKPEETVIKGGQVFIDGCVQNDASSIRIHHLIENHLVWIENSKDGWTKVFEDPTDGRLWKLFYPHSELHGGGPPSLHTITRDEAQIILESKK